MVFIHHIIFVVFLFGISLGPKAPVAEAQQTIQVPSQVRTIQLAIDQAVDGDTVNIAPGTYHESINFRGKNITVQGSGPGVVIDNLGAGAPVSIISGETRRAVLQNVTIQNGAAQETPDAGGILIENASPTIQNNSILKSAECGVAIVNGAPLMLNNHISGGTYISSSGGCLPAGAEDYRICGGGIAMYGVSSDGLQTQVTNNLIENNQSQNCASGIVIVDAGQPLIENNIIRNNSSAIYGAGILVTGTAAPLIIQNLIYGNTINPTLHFTPSIAGGAGINLAVDPTSTLPVYIVNNTIVDNHLLAAPFPSPGATIDGSQIEMSTRFDVYHFFNNLIIGNDSKTPVFCWTADDLPNGKPTLSNNDVYSSGTLTAYSGACASQTGTSGNISATPQFSTSATDANPYELLLSSPAVDAGDNSANSLPSVDLLGQARIQNAKSLPQAIVDMGVYEYPGTPLTTPVPVDFTLTDAPTTISVQPGSSGSTTVTVTPISGVPGDVALSCVNLRTTTTCSFSSSSLNVTSSVPQSATLTVSLNQTQAEGSFGEKSLFLSAVLFFPLFLGQRKRIAYLRGRLGVSLLLACTISLCAGMAGCTTIKFPASIPVTIQGQSLTSGITRQVTLTVIPTP